jgi:hypothetical protein
VRATTASSCHGGRLVQSSVGRLAVVPAHSVAGRNAHRRDSGRAGSRYDFLQIVLQTSRGREAGCASLIGEGVLSNCGRAAP